jgi:hypothetical protein
MQEVQAYADKAGNMKEWGPWETIEHLDMDKRTEAAVLGSDGDLVAYVDSGYEGVDFIEAIDRARLISAAPDMHEALQELMDEQNGPPLIRNTATWEAAMAKARAALSKAEPIGQSGAGLSRNIDA